MAILYGKFQKPEKIKVETSEKDPNFCRFIAEPFERGFGHTLGNALRRILLTSLEAPALLSIRIEGVSQEYTAIEGVIEDMTMIVLNLKGSLLRYLPQDDKSHVDGKLVTKELEITSDDILKAGGSYVVTLKDLIAPCEYEVVNPDHHIFTVTKPMTKKIDVRIGIGRGYLPSERQDSFECMVDEIILDASFSPVRLVNYFVENTRVGQDTDFDKLILEVKTDGRVAPLEALTFATQIAIDHFHVFDSLQKHTISFEEEEEECDKDRDEILQKLSLKINEIELSVRSSNCLAGANIETIGELVVMPESEMLKFRNFGKKSLTEIKKKLEKMGLHLSMDLSKYGITRENVKAIIEKHLEESAGNNS